MPRPAEYQTGPSDKNSEPQSPLSAHPEYKLVLQQSQESCSPKSSQSFADLFVAARKCKEGCSALCSLGEDLETTTLEQHSDTMVELKYLIRTVSMFVCVLEVKEPNIKLMQECSRAQTH